ncbi:MAG: type II secretion system F family protein [Candidatus Nealsonbacteria bacterium]|nr:type II secretion system F family protein [Candidatus Nealsonbacteria bacterium]
MKFNYQARNKKGDIQIGTVEASSREAALSLLQKNNLFITSLEKAGAIPFYYKKIKLFERVSKRDIVNFSRQLALMFKSKIPLVQALGSIAEQTKNPGLKESILAISKEVEGGARFSQALSGYPKLFSKFYVSMVKSGEISGTLSGSLTYLADHLEKEYYLQSKIQGAMIYPILIVVVVVGVLVMMMYFVIPNMTKVLTETGQELPLLTKIVINLSNFSRAWGWAVLLFFIGLLVAFFRYIKTLEGKRIKDRVILRAPVIGSFLKMIYLSRFAENLSVLIKGGLPISQSLEITGEIVGNEVYRDIISEIKEEVGRGEKISSVLSEHSRYFPPLLTQMVSVGEKTGTLDESLMNVVEFYQKEVERAINNLLSIIEPVMVIVLGGIVAGLMGAVMLPLYKMGGI